MKKVILSIVAILLVAGTVVFATTTTKKNNDCSNTKDCVSCPCTPDCQPGDPNCTCPESCKK